MVTEPSRVEALLSSLRPALAELLRAALAHTRTLVEPRTPADHGPERALWDAALKEAGLASPPGGGWSRREIPPATDLSPEQRTVAEVLALTPGPYLMEYKLPAAAWVRREWLGIEPPGPLFTVKVDGVALYDAVREAVRRDAFEAEKMLAALPAAERTAALCDLRLASLDHFEPHAEALLHAPLPDLGESARGWAIAFADRLLAVFAPDQPAAERGNMKGVPVDLARAAFVSLVRAGVPLEPRWDALLPLEKWMSPEERALCIQAVPDERRDAAVATALGRIFFDGARADVALEVLNAFSVPAAARCIVDGIAAARDAEQALAALREVGKTNPAVAAIARPLEKTLARADRLRVAKSIHPITRESLDATRTKQLEAANRKYGGKKMSVEQLFGAEDEGAEHILPQLTKLVLLYDTRGKPVYDAWLYMGDSGCIFNAGTTTVVAEIVQGGLECKKLGLKLALKAALREARG